MSEPRKSPPKFLLLLAAIATVLVGIVLAPFAGALFTAAVAAGVLYPLQRRLSERLGDRPAWSAGLITAAVMLLAIGPFVWLSIIVSQEVSSGVRQATRIVETEGVEGLIERTPEGLHSPLTRVVEYVRSSLEEEKGSEDAEGKPANESDEREDAGEGESSGEDQSQSKSPSSNALQLGSEVVQWVAMSAAAIVASIIKLTIDLGVIVLALFALLSRGDELVAWFIDVVPLPDDQTQTLVTEMREVTRGVFIATVVTALVQTVVALIAYLIAGTPYLALLTMATLLAALVPAIGGATMVFIVGLLTLLAGETGMGIFLMIWGFVPVNLCDNLVKPLVAQDRLRMPAAVVLFAMLGGIAVFGPIGLVAGPLVVAFFLGTLRLLQKTTGSRARVEVAAR